MDKQKLRRAPFFLDEQGLRWVEQTLSEMTPEEKAGQLFCISPLSLEEGALRSQMALKPCGLMLRPYDTDEVVEAVNKLNQMARIPLLLAADLEKGANGISNQGTIMGSPLGIAATDDVENAARLGRVCGEEGRTVGLNWTFGPIVDIDKNPFNPIMNVRTFGSDVERVKQMGLAYLREVQRCGMAAACKHFPGDGVDFRDQHIVGTTNSLSVEEWNASYGEIYKACIQAGTMSIMVGHIYQPAWAKRINPQLRDEDMLPASMSEELMQGLLRRELGFNGVIVTDATTMTGFMQALPRPQLIPQVIASGVDVILFSLNFAQDRQYILDAMRSGSLPEARVDEAVTRILAMKAALGLHRGTQRIDPERARAGVGTAEHWQWASEIADRSVTLVKQEPGVLPLTPQKYPRILYIPLEGKPDMFAHNRIRSGASARLGELLRQEGFQVHVLAQDDDVFPHMRIVEWLKEHFDAIVYCANFGTTSNQTVVRIQWPNNNMGWCPNFVHTIPTIFVSIENPYHLLDVPRVKTYINAYSPTDTTIQAVLDKLVGRSEFVGHSPVDPFCGLWEAKL